MSGGSYDYLCFQEFLVNEDQLLKMGDRLNELGYFSAADETYRIISFLKEIDSNDKLREAWRAVEWLDSSDHSRKYTEEVIESLGWKKYYQ